MCVCVCVCGFWFFFLLSLILEGGKKEAREQRICGMGKERREKITLKGKMLK